MTRDPDVPTPHAVIAGTGRAGTTFLMEFLRRAGVPGPALDQLTYHPEASAGLERSLLDAGDDYLVKDPWLYEYLDRVDASGIVIDALIVPVRDLRAAAASRLRQEVRRRVRAGGPVGWSAQGDTPGGLVFSLSVDDEERLLAVGQARLLAWALERRVPLYLLHHPRLVEDAEDTVDALWPWLQRFCTRDDALAAFRATFRPTTGTPVSGAGDAEQIRLREELLALDAERRRVDAELLTTTARLQEVTRELAAASARVHELEQQSVADDAARTASQWRARSGRLVRRLLRRVARPVRRLLH